MLVWHSYLLILICSVASFKHRSLTNNLETDGIPVERWECLHSEFAIDRG